MDFKKIFHLCFVALFSIQAASAFSDKDPVGIATISHRVSKPGQRLELLITVRNAQPPVSALPQSPVGLELRRLRKPQRLNEGGEVVWLLRFRIIPKAVGDYEIPPIRVSDRKGSALTKSVILHVSNDQRPPLPDARELALTTDIPLGLAQEAVNSCPSPSSTPVPTPTPRNLRPFPSSLISSVVHGVIWFWNYPGK
jgi:hypothetical protein